MTDFNNYNLGTNSVWKAHVITYCYEGLVATDYDLSTVPWLATGWTFTEATLTVDVDIRTDVLFHDGTPMTVDDVIYSYKMVRDGTTYSDRIVQAFDQDADGAISDTEFSDGVIRVDDDTVRFVMAQPYGQFFSSTLSVPIVPMAIWDDPLNGFTDADDKVIVTIRDGTSDDGAEGVPGREFRQDRGRQFRRRRRQLELHARDASAGDLDDPRLRLVAVQRHLDGELRRAGRHVDLGQRFHRHGLPHEGIAVGGSDLRPRALRDRSGGHRHLHFRGRRQVRGHGLDHRRPRGRQRARAPAALGAAVACELCEADGGKLLWQHGLCRVVSVDEPGLPGFLRVILNRHVREMTDLAERDRAAFMAVVFAGVRGFDHERFHVVPFREYGRNLTRTRMSFADA